MKQKLSWMGVIITSMVLGAGLVTGLNSLDSDDGPSPVAGSNPDVLSETPGGVSRTRGEELAGVAELYSRVRPSVVRINTSARGGATGQGSGVIIDKQGNILTNNHVIAGAEQIDVTLGDGTSAAARVVGSDPGSDLAVIRVSLPESQLRPVVLGNSDKVVAGQFVIAVGNPFGIEGSVTQGIVSGIGRTLSSGSGRPLRQLIQADAAINPGNSGGGLFDSDGQLIGITTAIENPSGDRVFVGIGYAVPVNTVQRYLPDMLAGRVIEHPRLGVGLQDVTPALARNLGLKVETGVLVTQVEANSGAQRAGLRANRAGLLGDVIVDIDGQAMRTFADLANYVDSKEVGDKVRVKVNREGQEITVEITLDAWRAS